MIPDYQSLMLPVLQEGAEKEISTRDAIENLASKYELSDEDRVQMLPSGKQHTFDNRVNWAKSYLKQAGLLGYPKRGYFVATDECMVTYPLYMKGSTHLNRGNHSLGDILQTSSVHSVVLNHRSLSIRYLTVGLFNILQCI